VLPAVVVVPAEDPTGEAGTQAADGEIVGDVALPVVTGFVVR
jgi:hypothetical protein